MTKQLADLLNIEQREPKEIIVADKNDYSNQIANIDETIIELSSVTQFETDMNALASTAMDAYEEIIELAGSAEPHHAPSYYSVAAQMHRNAMEAKNNSVKARLKAMDLLMKKKSLDMKKELDDADVIDEDDVSESGVITGDRNSVLASLKDNDK